MVQIAQLILSLSILVVLHELGHFIPAKIFKTRVEKFYLFFDPWFSLIKFKKGDTEYGIGWLPLGGYVKISGMIDESMDKEQMKQDPQPWEFRSKPAWQRLIIMLGGIIVNFILGFSIYIMILFAWGKEYIPIENLKYGIACDSLALRMGFMDGDQVVSVEKNPITTLSRMSIDVIMNRAKSVEVMRDGQMVTIPINDDDLGLVLKALKTKSFVAEAIPCFLDSIIPNSPASRAGLMKGDNIVAVDNYPTPFHHLVQRKIHSNKKKSIDLLLMRGADTLVKTVQISENGTIGFYPKVDGMFETKKVKYSFAEAIPAGIAEGYEKVVMQVKQFAVLFMVKDAHQSIGGFYTMTKNLPTEWDWQGFWSFTAFLSMVLAFMNFLPIPALDGGHVMFLLYEMITRRKPSEKFLIYAQYVGIFLLLSLMVYANLDWLRD